MQSDQYPVSIFPYKLWRPTECESRIYECVECGESGTPEDETMCIECGFCNRHCECNQPYGMRQNARFVE